MAAPRRLLDEVLQLSTVQREELLRALLDSLDETGEDDGHAAAWDVEIERRLNDDDRGSDDVVTDGRDALAKLRAEVLDE